MEKWYEEELIKLKAGHDEFEARIRCPQGDERSAHMISGHT